MFCPNCGTKNEDDAVFCSNCGTSLKAQEEASVQEAQAPAEEIQESVQETEAPVEPIDVPVQSAETPIQPVDVPVQPVETPIQQAKPKKPRKPISKKLIAIITACVVVVVAAVTFVIVGNNASDYKKIAVKYFTAVNANDWDKVYNYLDLPSNAEFLTKDNLKKVHALDSTKEISNYAIDQQSTDYANKANSLYNSGNLLKEVYIDYRLKGGTSNKTANIEMIKTDKKTMFFFDTYKVAMDEDLIAQDITIRVAKNAKVIIDGIEVSDEYLENESSSSTKTSKTYVIDYMFTGNHTINITQDNMEDIEDTFEVLYDDDYYSNTEQSLKKVVLDQQGKAAEEAFKAIYDTVASGKNFSEVSKYFTTESTSLGKMKTSFESFAQKQTITSITWSNLAGTASQSSTTSDGSLTIKVNVRGNYSAVGKSRYSSNENEVTKTGTVSCNLYYKYVDGAWGIYDMSLDTIYLY